VGNAPRFPAMPELNELGQMTPAVKHAHEKRMENYKIQMNTYDLIRNNCNHFANTICEYLTGHGIPNHIVDLPAMVQCYVR
jgi:hypothetical protein